MKLIVLFLLPVFCHAQSNVLKYQWRKISGPPQYTIVSPLSAFTKVTNLVEGVYKFELKVTNRYNLSARDTMVVTVNTPAAKFVATALNVPKAKQTIY